MATCPQVSGTEQVIARMSLNGVTVRVVYETTSDSPYVIYITEHGKSVIVDSSCKLDFAMREATRHFLAEVNSNSPS